MHPKGKAIRSAECRSPKKSVPTGYVSRETSYAVRLGFVLVASDLGIFTVYSM